MVPVRGFPIRWSTVGLEWYPYLPTVISFHYPIFRGMDTSPRIIHDGTGYRLEASVISWWSAIELAMIDVIQSLKEQRMTTSGHKPPSYPYQYGYKWTHPRRRVVKGAVRKSLCAFQQLLAYCSYAAAGVESPVRGRSEPFYRNPSLVEDIIIDRPPSTGEADRPHILRKLLWGTLGEIRQTRNFVGAAISYRQPFDYEFLSEMVNYGVPVYVSWSNLIHEHSYSAQPLRHLLSEWCPPSGVFRSSGSLPEAFGSRDPPATHLDEDTSPVHRPSRDHHTYAVPDKRSPRYPWEYVRKREDQIASKLTKSGSSNQSILARADSASRLVPLGRRGASVYQFEHVETLDESTGEVTEMWDRVALTRPESMTLWDHVKRRHLWYG